MTPQHRTLALIESLSSAEFARIYELGRSMLTRDLRAGLWLGRNAGVPRFAAPVLRYVIRRYDFAKLIFDGGWGINVRVRQDGSHTPLQDSRDPNRTRMDLPFTIRGDALDYGLHVAGFELDPRAGVLLRDTMRVLPRAALIEAAPERSLARSGWSRADADTAADDLIALGYIVPLGLAPLAMSPFGMVWSRLATEEERDTARRYLTTRRPLDTTPGAHP